MNIKASNKYKSDCHKIRSRGLKIADIMNPIIDMLKDKGDITGFDKHELSGDKKGYYDCHLSYDYVLLYKIDKSTDTIYFERLGRHEDLLESMNLSESRVGAFYMVNGDILSNDVDVRDGEEYGDFVNYSSHWDLWRAAQRQIPALRRIEYDTFPRGRVIYNKGTHKYIIFLDHKLNNVVDIDIITDTYDLSPGSYIVDDEDEHYVSDDHPPQDVYIDESVHFTDSLDNYIKRETY